MTPEGRKLYITRGRFLKSILSTVLSSHTMYKIIRPLLFFFYPEKAHHLAMSMLTFVLKVPGLNSFYKKKVDKSEEVELFGLKFRNRVGIAAGFDKEAKYIDQLSAIGFGFVEIGTVTPKPQPGNPKPRLFRLKKDEALINRMGFNSNGVEVAVRNLKKKKSDIIVGGNIGKNKVTPNEQATEDYLSCFNALFPHVDYFAINVSSPNTPNLRSLQEKEPLTKLINTLQEANNAQKAPKPLLLKIAPDLTNEQLDDIVEIAKTTGLSGIIATNTTISRADLTTSEQELNAIGAGGLSGKPVKERSTEVISYLYKQLGDNVPIIGVGGIHNAADAQEKIAAGAKLVQVYTGFIYEGQALVNDIRAGF